MPTSKPAPLSRSRWAGVPAEERAAERRIQLVDAGFDLLGTEGDAGTTVRAVCQRARLNPRYFYESFADRDELLVAVYDHVVADLGEVVAAAVLEAGDDPEGATRAGISTIVRYIADDPRRAKVLYNEALGNAALNRRRIDTNHLLMESLVNLTRPQRKPTAKSERVASVAAAMLVGGLSELILAWLERRIDIELDELVDDAVAMFLSVGETADAWAADYRPGAMGEPRIDLEPKEAGFDPERLRRLDTHFARYVDDGRLPGWQLAVARHGHLAHWTNHGFRDREASRPVEDDTIWRIYSMTKPITSVAAMLLVEEGRFELKDPVAKFIPSFADARVYRGGSALRPETDPVTEPMLIWHLLTHTSGLTYGFHHAHPVDAIYRAAGFEFGSPPGLDTAALCDLVAGLPLLFQPGAEWNYGVSTDVLGHVVEMASGQRLDDFLRTRIFEPLGMRETAFHVEESEFERLAGLYVANPADGTALRFDGLDPANTQPPAFLAGGGGLVSTMADYLRFCQFLQKGTAGDGTRILGPRTLAYMARNHLPGGVDLMAFGRPLFSETTFEGVGFGLGFSVTEDPAANKVIGSRGDFGWGGAASTFFWIDPVEDMSVVFLTSLLPSSTHPIRSEIKTLVHQALR